MNVVRTFDAEAVKAIAMRDDIWEARIAFGSNAYRVFFFFERGNVVILTHGLIKKTQKTTKQEIERAENYKKDKKNYYFKKYFFIFFIFF